MNPVREPFLGELERAVMEVLWSEGSCDAKEVYSTVGRERGITLNTIQSTMKRLFIKGFLSRVKESHAHIYAPAIDRESFFRQVLGRVVEELAVKEPANLIPAFVDLADRVSTRDLERLERLLGERIEARKATPS